MTLSSVLMADREARPDWYAVGIAMIVVDRLVHNFLVRTGILEQLGMVHPYGPRCYADGGCAEVLRRVSAQIDARQFDRNFPADFPRFVQHALWRYCAADGLNVCNGNNIDDRKSCDLSSCIVYSNCAKKARQAEGRPVSGAPGGGGQKGRALTQARCLQRRSTSSTLSASAIIVYGIDATLSKSLRKFRSDAFTTKAVASALHQTQLVRERHDRITGSRA